jgi:hypothetical protein
LVVARAEKDLSVANGPRHAAVLIAIGVNEREFFHIRHITAQIGNFINPQPDIQIYLLRSCARDRGEWNRADPIVDRS